MKRLASAALIGALAIGAPAATAAGASADPYDYVRHQHAYPRSQSYQQQSGYDDGGGYLAAGIIALTAGLVASQVLAPEPPSYPIYAAGYGGDTSHIQWCETTYRSYSPETDLWRDYQGYMRLCEGPY